MRICLERESATYLTGEIVKGTVAFAITQEAKVEDLTLRFFGEGRVSWKERGSYFKGSSFSVNLKNTDVFLDQTISILNRDSRNASSKPTKRSTSSSSSIQEPEMNDGLSLPPGLHSFPFQWKLPADLPASTFDARWGQVRYTISALLQRSWRFDIEREREFTVMTSLDLNDEPELARPIECLDEFSPGAFCCRTGHVMAALRLERRGYVPGEKINFQVKIETTGPRRLHNHRVALIQHVTFRAKTQIRRLTTCVNSLSRGEVLPGASSIWTRDSLTVPVVPPTSNRSYRNIQIKYTFSLLVYHSSWSDDFCLPVAVVIGTSRLKPDTSNRYLPMIGHLGMSLRPSTPQGQGRNVSCGDLSTSSANNSSPKSSSSRFLPRGSLPPTPDDAGRRRTSNGSLQQQPNGTHDGDRESKTANTGHRSFDCIHETGAQSLRPDLPAATIASHGRASACRMSY